jgi:hypothetical protein
MKVLIGCESSGVVRRAFRVLGHSAYSCDLEESEDGSEFHIRADVLTILDQGWDMAIFHPPCTHLAVSGSRWFSKKRKEQVAAFEFFMRLALCDIPKIGIEQPVSVVSSRWRKPDQVIQPWMFGHPEYKATCLFLKGLPALVPTKVVRWKANRRPKRLANRVHYMGRGPNRARERSRTLTGIAAAMADQWGRES